MDISAVGNAQSFAGLTNSPMAQLLQSQAQGDSTLFTGASGEPSDLIGFTSTAASSTLFNDPSLLLQLQNWDGSPTPGSDRVAAPAATPTQAPATPQFSFNPFDQSTWSGAPAPQSSDSAPSAPQGYSTATGTVVPYPQFSFNPFDESSWWTPPSTGTNVDASA
jgi:hypothetical protein